MKPSLPCLLFIAALIPLWPLAAQQPAQSSHVGYAYPSGGQAGTTVDVTLGGKGFFNVRNVIVSGDGVSAEFVEQISGYKNKLQEHIRILRAEKNGKPTVKLKENRRFGPPPAHPYFTRLEDLSPEEFMEVADKFGKMERVQKNREIDQLAVIRLTLAADAQPGMREIRLVTATGVTNPVRFMVGSLPELSESEPNDRQPREVETPALPFVMNGQIQPGDTDWLGFQAAEGQKVAITVQARALVPFLADAVPGWFQPVITLTDAKGKELAHADDFRFDPDPVMRFTAPESGSYRLVIRDSIYRGREDFVYRISVEDAEAVTHPGPKASRVSSLPRLEEATIASVSSRLEAPVAIHGRIDQPDDIDLYEISAKAGEQFLISVHARRLLSPTDSLVRVLDEAGAVLAWNDDMDASGQLTDRIGLLTHNSDSELLFTAPVEGRYFVQLSDTQRKGGRDYTYRLEISRPEPDFELYVTPSGIGVPAGSAGMAMLYLKRIHGFNGEVVVRLDKPPRGFSLSGATIPAGCDSIPFVIKAPFMKLGQFERLNLSASAVINGRRVRKQAIPADDVTQAFVIHHLVPAEGLVVASTSRSGALPGWSEPSVGPVVLQAGDPTELLVSVPDWVKDPPALRFELAGVPEGVLLQAEPCASGYRLLLESPGQLQEGQAGNIVISVLAELPGARGNKGKKNSRMVTLGALPALPYVTRQL